MCAKFWALVSRAICGGAISGLVGLALLVTPAAAAPDPVPPLGEASGPVTNLPMPRFVSLNASKINLRRGPGLDYRVDWVLRRSGLPVLVLDEYEGWRRIRDHEGDEGWVYHALISGRRTAIVTAPGAVLRQRPVGVALGIACAAAAPPADAVACAEAGVIAKIDACERFWCRIETDGHAGWVPKSALWGAGAEEIFGE